MTIVATSRVAFTDTPAHLRTSAQTEGNGVFEKGLALCRSVLAKETSRSRARDVCHIRDLTDKLTVPEKVFLLFWCCACCSPGLIRSSKTVVQPKYFPVFLFF